VEIHLSKGHASQPYKAIRSCFSLGARRTARRTQTHCSH